MRILICIMEYYPLQNASANCVSNIVDRIKKDKKDLSVDVLTFKTRPDDLEEEEYRNTTIFRLYDIRRVRRKDYFSYCETKPLSIIQKAWFCLLKTVGQIQKRIAITPCRVFSRSIYKAIRELDEHKSYDAILSVSGDFAISYACAKYKEKRNRAKLYTYLLDPLCGNFLYKHYNERKVREDQEFIFRESDFAVVTPIIYATLSDVHNVVSCEFPSFFEDEEITENKNNIQFDHEKVNLLYTGVFYREIRDPEYLVKLISQMDKKTVLHICGHFDAAYEIKYKKLIEKGQLILHGNVSHEIMYNAIMEADYLVNVGNSTDMMLPSKLISYISTGKPIINIYQIKSCPTLNYLQNYNNNINLSQTDSIDDNIIKLNDFISKPIKIIPKEEILSNYRECTTSYIVNNIFEPLLYGQMKPM